MGEGAHSEKRLEIIGRVDYSERGLLRNRIKQNKDYREKDYMEREHTRRRDIHGGRTNMERGYTQRGDYLEKHYIEREKGTHTEKRVEGERRGNIHEYGTHTERRLYREGTTWGRKRE